MNATHFEQSILPAQAEPTTAQRPRRGVGQDNPAHPSAPLPTLQPAPRKKVMRTAPKAVYTQSPQQRMRRQRKDVQLNLWVRPGVKAELQRVAKREGLSVSAAGEALLENALHQDIHTQHGA